jgi:hypothetical protein
MYPPLKDEIQQNCFVANKPAFLILQKKKEDRDDDDLENKEKTQRNQKETAPPRTPLTWARW